MGSCGTGITAETDTMKQLPIPGFPGYEITEGGRVWSMPRIDTTRRAMKGRWLKNDRSSKGYCRVRLYLNGRGRLHPVHRLVLETFMGPCPKGMEACHNNGIRADNRLDNLRWDSRSENARDAVKHGTKRTLFGRGERHPRSKLTWTDVRWVRALHGAGVSCRELAGGFPVSLGMIKNIVGNRNWRTSE